jgi:hypothetical protein
MKLRILALAALASLFVACGGGKNTPESVTERFHKSLTEADYSTAKSLATEEGKKSIESLESMANMGNAMGNKEEKKKVEIKEVKCETKETDAVCTCKSVEGGEEKTTTYNLVKKDDKWLVDYKKLDLGGGDMNMTPESDTTNTDMNESTEGDSTATE